MRNWITAVVVLSAGVLVAGDRSPDTLLILKNGSEVRAVLIEIKDGFYSVELKDGRPAKFALDDVERMERLAAEPADTAVAPTPTPAPTPTLQPCNVFITEGTLDESLYVVVKEVEVSKKWKGGELEEAMGMLADQAIKIKADGVLKVRKWNAPSGFSWSAPHAGGIAFTWTAAGRAALPSLKGRCF